MYFLVRLQRRSQQNQVAIGESVGEVELVVASVNEVEVEAFDGCGGKGAYEAGVGSVLYFSAELSIFLGNLCADDSGVVHL